MNTTGDLPGPATSFLMAVKSAAHRLRHRYREALRRHIAETVAVEGEAEDEIRRLFAVFGEPGLG